MNSKFRIIFVIVIFITIILLWLDFVIFHSKLWLIKGIIYIIKETQLYSAEARSKDYEKFYNENKDDLMIMKEKYAIKYLLPYNKEDIQINSVSCNLWSCEFQWNDGYLLVHHSDHNETVWKVFIDNIAYISLVINKDWYVFAWCSRFTCSESQLR